MGPGHKEGKECAPCDTSDSACLASGVSLVRYVLVLARVRSRKQSTASKRSCGEVALSQERVGVSEEGAD